VAAIYSDASLCIATNRATHCDEGFLHHRERETWNQVSFEDEDGVFDLYFQHDRSVSLTELYECKLEASRL
jgi:hypothetical protein